MDRHIHCTNKFHILENSSHDTEYKHAGKIALYYLLKILDGIRYDWLAIFS